MGSLRSIPTGTAWLLAAVGAACFVAGWRLGWVELFVVAASCVLAILVAIPFVLRRGNVLIERTINPNRVEVGLRAVAEIRATNRGSAPSPALTVDERIDGVAVAVDIPSLAAQQTSEFIYTLPTEKRGKFTIGPASIGRSDPLGLMHRSISETSIEDFFVYPRTMPTKALAAGFAKDLEGPTFDSSPAGDVAFHTIREYQPGDDVRHVHWMSTAKKNTLMVRHYVDNRRPQIAVLVDGSLADRDPEVFEIALEVAASIGVSSLHRDTPVAAWVDDTVLVGRRRPRGVDDLLDDFAAIKPRAGADLVTSADQILRVELGTSVLVVVTAGREAADLVTFCDRFRRRAQIILVDIDSAPQALPLSGVRVLQCSSLAGFAQAWGGLS